MMITMMTIDDDEFDDHENEEQRWFRYVCVKIWVQINIIIVIITIIIIIVVVIIIIIIILAAPSPNIMSASNLPVGSAKLQHKMMMMMTMTNWWWLRWWQPMMMRTMMMRMMLIDQEKRGLVGYQQVAAAVKWSAHLCIAFYQRLHLPYSANYQSLHFIKHCIFT